MRRPSNPPSSGLTVEAALGRALDARAAGRDEEARALVDAVLRAVPDSADAWNQDGLLRLDERDFDGAERSFRRAIELGPSFAHAHFNRALALLAKGDYAQGWREYEWRMALPDEHGYALGLPRWNAEPLGGRRILVQAEQGYGDTIQFSRFIAALAASGAIVDFFCQRELAPLMARVPGVRSAFGDFSPAMGPHDFFMPLLDIASQVVPTGRESRWKQPYVRALPERIEAWRAEIEAMPRPRVGLVWKGSARNANDRTRSLAAAQAAKLARHAGSTISLQLGQGSLGRLPNFVEIGERLADWEDTAAVIEHLDLLVSVDTAPAHLAGAMGKPVWTLIPFSPDWRWGLEGAATPWYPTMRLFRQERRGDWDTVIDRVLAALEGPGLPAA